MVIAMTLAAFLLPSLSMAAGGEDVNLRFTSSDNTYLVVSLVFGFIAIAFGFYFRGSVLSQSKGSEKMQEVGGAIKAGAMAYLSQQVRTMSIFVGLLAIGLFLMYNGKPGYDGMIPLWIAVSFVGGVAASYIAGYVGMLMAVESNMRTAHAALTSYGKALETAFRSGAVAGLFTVGMGLIGATAIFLLAKGDAMKLLIGFGFGGSLAALFMRVGGGIFTKAADVGADLVGKVEAGIPEDDPRNPAVIADNVGDNVGDCAGMAADIFESYEVTLVAAIVLGAATAAIFDQATWMKLVMFALMARGVGILASILGIFMVKGSDNVDSEPLHAIRKGFYISAAVAALLSAGLAWWMLGGQSAAGKVNTNSFVTQNDVRRDQIQAIKDAAAAAAEKKGTEEWEVTDAEVKAELDVEEVGLNPQTVDQDIPQARTTEMDSLPKDPKMEGFSKLDFTDVNNPVLGYAAVKKPAADAATQRYEFITVKDRYAGTKWAIYKVHLKRYTAPEAVEGQTTTPPPTVSEEMDLFFGPLEVEDKDKIMSMSQPNVQELSITGEYPVDLYANADGELALALSSESDVNLSRLVGPEQFQALPVYYFKMDPADVQAAFDKRQTQMDAPIPTPLVASVATVEQTEAEWWKFALCIAFGIAMAIVFEYLTDYYVSLRGRPVREVAEVATAGPAPMIITGFALGKESSVFSVFAIVAALIAPLLIFNPADYGGYLLSFYGIALVGLGLLTTTGFILAMDTFGPISDNAQGVFEMSGAGHDNPEAGKGIQRLDAAGNTTKALTKGFAIATAVVAAVALFHAYVESAQLTVIGMRLEIPEIFLGLLIGGAAPFLFSAFSINAVGRAAFELINEVRRQFKADPGIMAGTSKPDYARCVGISTAAAQRELLGPGILAIAFPALVAFGFAIGKEPTVIDGVSYNLVGAQALGGFLAGAILSGQLMAVLLANSGGIWDNAKKLIEDGMHGGKGTDAHKAAVVCDTVGDPFKDTAGPALNPLIKVMNLVALLLAPVVIQPLSNGVLIAVTAVSALALVVAIWWSKRSGMGSAMQSASAE
jgi:K(+)-stimulated pyrophosphate-energized sodium pump